MLAMEQEIPGLLMVGSGLVLGVSLIMIISWWRETRHLAFGWFMGSLICLSIGIYLGILVIEPKEIPSPKISEENSLRIGWAGVMWAFSMACMLLGISK